MQKTINVWLAFFLVYYVYLLDSRTERLHILLSASIRPSMSLYVSYSAVYPPASQQNKHVHHPQIVAALKQTAKKRVAALVAAASDQRNTLDYLLLR